ncbi:hypothetical protein D3C86_1897400 [compost metagenome]
MLIGEGGAGMLGVDGLGQSLRAVQVAIGDGDLGALLDQHPRHGLPQTARRPGDQGGLAGDAARTRGRHST